MTPSLDQARQTFILGMSRISQFWGFPRAMGALYGAIYLSPDPVSLDELVELTAITKGAVSTNVRALERLGMVQRINRLGERKDFYLAETDFWKVIKGILREREKSEFDLALRSVDECLALLDQDGENNHSSQEQSALAAFYRQRLGAMQAFFRTLDNLVAGLLALDHWRVAALHSLLGKAAGAPTNHKGETS
jgi:DNA-binding transcriptional regulator GbsR (MarR family)